jgi:high affinity Mn2+ porin
MYPGALDKRMPPLSLSKSVTLTFYYQFMMIPAYNADRGPISFFAGRLHAEF